MEFSARSPSREAFSLSTAEGHQTFDDEKAPWNLATRAAERALAADQQEGHIDATRFFRESWREIVENKSTIAGNGARDA